MISPSASIYLPELWFNQVVVVDGMARSGKSLVASALSSLKHMEPWQLPIYVDHVVKYLQLGEFSREGASTALRIGLNSHAFDYAVGRGLNRRATDGSSVTNYHDEKALIERESNDSYKDLLANFLAESSIPVFVTHEQICFANFWMEAVPHLNYIEVVRHPVTTLLSWSRRGLTQRWGGDPLLFVPCLEEKGVPYPLFAQDARDEWFRSTLDERLILSLELQYNQLWSGLDWLNPEEKNNFRIVQIENFKSDTLTVIKSIAEWLRVPVLNERLGKFMNAEQLPSSKHGNDIAMSIEKIRVQFPASIEFRVHKLVEKYEHQLKKYNQLVL